MFVKAPGRGAAMSSGVSEGGVAAGAVELVFFAGILAINGGKKRKRQCIIGKLHSVKYTAVPLGLPLTSAWDGSILVIRWRKRVGLGWNNPDLPCFVFSKPRAEVAELVDAHV